MANKRSRIYLKDGFAISVSLKTLHGQVISFVVRLIDARGDPEKDLARYDTAHGRPHLDILTASGNLKSKHWMEDTNLNDAFNDALQDFQKNYENYLHEC